MMGLILALLCALCMWNGDAPQTSGKLTVRVEGLRHETGLVGVSVYRTEQGWPDKWKEAVWSKLVPIESNPPEIVIPDLPRGRLAVSVIHDENESGDMDKNLLGIPKEGYGVSNNIKPGTFGPPQFDDATFVLTDRDTLISITLQY